MTGKLNIVKFIKRFPWWFYVVVLIAILFVWQGASGWSQSRRLWNMVRAEIVADQERIIEELERDNLVNQKEKETLYRQIEQLSKQRAELQKEKDQLRAKIEEIQNAMENVNIPDSPDALVDLLRKHGLKSIQRRPK